MQTRVQTMPMHVRQSLDITEDRIVAVLTTLMMGGIAATLALGGATDILVHAAYYITKSGAVAGGVAAGSGAVIGAGISASQLSGAALAGATAGGVVGVLVTAG